MIKALMQATREDSVSESAMERQVADESRIFRRKGLPTSVDKDIMRNSILLIQ
jgi:hypothetical protein